MVKTSKSRTKDQQDRIEKRVRAKLCLSKLVQEKSQKIIDCPNVAEGRLGLCRFCYRRFNNEAKRCEDETEKAQYEAKMIQEGLVLAVGESRKLKNTNLLSRRDK